MAVSRAKKQETLEQLKGALSDAQLVVLVHNNGLTVAEVSELRRKVRAAGAGYKVAKNTLTKRVIKDTQFASLDGLLKGPIAIAYSKDAVAAAKVVSEYANNNDKITIVGGVLDGQALSLAAIKNLATLPSLDELRGKIVGLLQAPATKIAGILQAPAGQLARVVGAYAAK
jgi:large subunit ribosomal protein L10